MKILCLFFVSKLISISIQIFEIILLIQPFQINVSLACRFDLIFVYILILEFLIAWLESAQINLAFYLFLSMQLLNPFLQHKYRDFKC